MNRFRTMLSAVVFAGAILAAAFSRGAEPAEEFRDEIRPILEKHCYECHGSEKQKGDLNLATYSDYQQVLENKEIWQLVLERTQAFEMPPDGKPDLGFNKHQKLMKWLRALPKPERVDCDQIASDRTANFYRGYVMSRRLNRSEYNNTIRDLFGIDLHLEDLLPADGGGGEGFDTSGNALFVSSIHVDPVAREINPRLAYERLFGVIRGHQATAVDRRQTDDNRALLNLVFDDARSLRRQLGRDDQYKLDEYLDSIRDVERRLEFFSKPDPRAWRPSTPVGEDLAAPTGAPGDHQQHVRLMLDLIALAFQTDSTRIGTFMFANDVSPKNFSALIPGTSSHHELSHHQNKAEKYEPYSKINRWHAEQLAYFLGKLQSVREGERTLLENSMVLFGSSMSDGNRHDPANLPIILAGRAGGKIDSGRHIACPKNTPLCNLYVSMLEQMGTPVQSFGDSTAPLEIT